MADKVTMLLAPLALLACRSGLVSDASVRHAPTDVDDPSEQDPIPPTLPVEEPDPVTGSGTTTLPQTEPPLEDTGAQTQAGGVGTQVCYPGSDGFGLTCLQTVVLSPVPSDYEYPVPLDSRYPEPSRYLDLDDIDPSLLLSPNFALDELAQSWKGQWAVVQPHAVETLQRLRDVLGATVVNSGYRNVAYNTSVGGATWSRHMYGDAFDIAAVSGSLDDVADACDDENAAYIGWYEAHIHCDWRDDSLDPVFYGDRAGGPGVVDETPKAASILAAGDLLSAPAEGWDEGEPLREWVALDAAGDVVGSAVGREFAIPIGAVEVEVTVGREVVSRWVR